MKRRSRHLVDPELLPLLDLWPPMNLSAETLEEMRARELPAMPIDPAVLEATEIEVRRILGPEGAPKVALYIYRPRRRDGPMGCIFHIHGGGYVVGDAAFGEPAHRGIAAGLGCAVVSVDYRLAPETVFPGAIEDCYAGLSWLFANAETLDVDARRVGVMGESAGGGLAAALALLARDRGEHELAFQHLVYPMLDDRTCTREDPNPHAGEFIWTPESNHFGWSSLIGGEPGADHVSPYAAAARAESLAGLPPAFIATAALDLFVDEDMDYARRLIRAGVPTELHVYPGAYHGFDSFADAPVSRQARADSLAALRRSLSGTVKAGSNAY